MKSDKEYIQGVYEKYENINKKNQDIKSPKFVKISIIAASVIAFMSISTYSAYVYKIMPIPQKYDPNKNIINEVNKYTKITKETARSLTIKILDNLGVKNQEIIEQKLMEDQLGSKSYWNNKTQDYEVQIDVDCGELKGLRNLKYDYNVKTNVNAQTATQVAKVLYQQMQFPKNYELAYINYYTENLWEAYWAPKYDGLYNYYQGIKICFNPDNSSINSITKFNNKFENNQVIIKIEEAKILANPIIDMMHINGIKEVKLEIVEANYMWTKNSTFAKKTNLIRKAWVVYCSDKYETKIYIDSTTGEIIGGNMLK